MQDIKNSILRRVYILYFFFLLFSLLIMVQILRIQIIQGKYWKEKAKEFSLKEQKIEATKGNIYADDGKELFATSVPLFELRLNANSSSIKDKDFNKTVGPLSDSLSKLFKDRSSAEYYNLIMKARRSKKGGGYLLLKRNVAYEQVKRVKKFPKFRSVNIAIGIEILQTDKRVMPYDLLAKRTIGFIGQRQTDHIDTIIKGKIKRKYFGEIRSVPVYAGIEGYYSTKLKKLTGVDGRELVRLSPGGQRLPLYNDSTIIEPINGKDIVTTINIDLQEVAHNSLAEQLRIKDADHGCAILMEVATGEVKAIVNLKRDSSAGKANINEVFNYAIGEASNPGSTFKLVSLLVALEDGVVDTNSRFETGFNEKKFGAKSVRDAEFIPGPLTVKEIFEHSSNIGTTQVVWKYYSQNPKKYVDGIYRLGIQNPLKLDIYGEKSPDIKYVTHPYWHTNYSLPSMAYGYEVELTPLQILTLYNAVANNGVMVKPRFVREIREMGNTVEKYYPQVINKRLCSKATIGKLRKMMEGVVERGTAKGCFKGAIYSVAGKTGTAQINFTEKGREKMTYRASFVGYFPAGNPKYSCIVVITNPKSRDYYGGTVSAPVFKDIADKVYSIFFNKYLDEKPQKIKKVMPAVAKVINSNDYRKIFNAMNLTGNNPPVKTDMTCLSIDTLLRASEMKMDKKAGVPNVTGMGLKDAVFTLEKAGFKVRVSGRGTVRNQALASPGEVKLDLM